MQKKRARPGDKVDKVAESEETLAKEVRAGELVRRDYEGRCGSQGRGSLALSGVAEKLHRKEAESQVLAAVCRSPVGHWLQKPDTVG